MIRPFASLFCRVAFMLPLAVCPTALCAAPAASTGASSQVPTTALYVSTEALKQIADGVAPDAKTGGPGGFSKRLFTTPNYSDSFIRIVQPDKPHAHGKWSEVYVILDGAATIETGGTIIGAVEGNSATHGALFLDGKPSDKANGAASASPPDPAAPKDLAGDDINGGTRQAVKPGDIILIPAGVPHRWVSVTKPIVYHDIKFPR